MPRKRERFERSDVPRDTPYRNVIGGVVCVLVLAAVVAVVLFVWNRVKLESNLGDKDISDALSAQAAQATPEAAGYVASGDEFESVVLFTADGLDAGGQHFCGLCFQQNVRVAGVRRGQRKGETAPQRVLPVDKHQRPQARCGKIRHMPGLIDNMDLWHHTSCTPSSTMRVSSV